MLRNYIKFTTLFTFLFWSKCFGAEEGMHQLNPEYWISQIFWLTLIFSFLYLILWKKILPKITENLENRKYIHPYEPFQIHNINPMGDNFRLYILNPEYDYLNCSFQLTIKIRGRK